MSADTSTQIKDLESFVKGLKQAAGHIHTISPDYVLFPMLGSLPFSDGLNVVDQGFDTYREKSFYLPASVSRGFRSASEEWLTNFINWANPRKPTKFVFVDEVKSGSCIRSLTDAMNVAIGNQAEAELSPVKGDLIKGNERGITQALQKIDERTGGVLYDKLLSLSDALRFGDNEAKRMALQDMQKFLKEHYSQMVQFSSVGIEHGNGQHITHGGAYNSLVSEGKVVPVKVNRIITMDDPDLAPARYKRVQTKYIPEIELTGASQAYLTLMNSIAQMVGYDTTNVSFPINQGRIMNSHQFLNRNYRKAKPSK